jgi:hypothetical protein
MLSEIARTKIGPIQLWIILFALLTALIHLYLAMQMIATGMSGILFILNGLGYLGLLGGLFLPLPVIKDYRPILRILFMVYTLVTILAWAAIGMRDVWGYSDKAVEVVLLILLWLDRSRK